MEHSGFKFKKMSDKFLSRMENDGFLNMLTADGIPDDKIS